MISLLIGAYNCTRSTDTSEETIDISKPLSELSPMDKDIMGDLERLKGDTGTLSDDSGWVIDLSDEALE